MKSRVKIVVGAALALALASTIGARPLRLKGALVGGVAGHYAGLTP